MRVGIPVFGKEIAPRFGTSSDFIVADIEEGEIVECRNMLVPAPSLERMPAAFLELGVQVVICCGISPWCEQALCERGIRVISGVMGTADAAMTCFCKGELKGGQILSPEAHKRGRGKGSNLVS